MGRIENLAYARKVKKEKAEKQKNCLHDRYIIEKGCVYDKKICLSCGKLLKALWHR